METLKRICSDHPFLRSLSPAYLDILTECAQPREFAAGDVIFREGEVANCFYLLERGKVLLESSVPPGGSLAVQELGPNDVLGWSWMFPPYLCHFQARALEPVRAISLNGAHLLVACERDHEFGYELMKRLAQILIRRLQATRKQFVKLRDARELARRA